MILEHQQRRMFLRQLGLLALPLGVNLSATAGALRGRVQIAVKYHMIREPGLTVLEKFRLLQEVGLDGTELKTDERIERNEVQEAVQKTGLPVHGIINASNPDIVSAIDLCRELGGTSVLVLAQEDSRKSYPENFAHWQNLVAAALPRAEATGIQLCIENVRATFLKTAEEMARFIDSFDSPLVRSYFDLGNTITWTEQPAEHWARVLGSRISKLDIKDRGHPEFGDAKLKRPGVVGTNGGEVHWERVRQELAQISFSGWATAEVAGGDRERLAGIASWIRDVLELGDPPASSSPGGIP